jgi:uncharacterized protein (UPF0332 family)
MSINPKEFIAVAKNLGIEAEFRTAVGRLYYSLYHVSLRRLIQIKELDRVPHYDPHSKVVSTVKSIRLNLGDKLDRLRMIRRQADYVLSDSDQEFKNDFRDWLKNYKDAKAIADSICPSLEQLARKQG